MQKYIGKHFEKGKIEFTKGKKKKEPRNYRLSQDLKRVQPNKKVTFMH